MYEKLYPSYINLFGLLREESSEGIPRGNISWPNLLRYYYPRFHLFVRHVIKKRIDGFAIFFVRLIIQRCFVKYLCMHRELSTLGCPIHRDSTICTCVSLCSLHRCALRMQHVRHNECVSAWCGVASCRVVSLTLSWARFIQENDGKR